MNHGKKFLNIIRPPLTVSSIQNVVSTGKEVYGSGYAAEVNPQLLESVRICQICQTNFEAFKV